MNHTNSVKRSSLHHSLTLNSFKKEKKKKRKSIFETLPVIYSSTSRQFYLADSKAALLWLFRVVVLFFL